MTLLPPGGPRLELRDLGSNRKEENVATKDKAAWRMLSLLQLAEEMAHASKAAILKL